MKTCKNCGGPLKKGSAQKVFCSKSCGRQNQLKKQIEGICSKCGLGFIIKRPGQKYCKECGGTRIPRPLPEEFNRPYTSETKYLIRLWLSKGDTVEYIAQALGRTIENVKQALV